MVCNVQVRILIKMFNLTFTAEMMYKVIRLPLNFISTWVCRFEICYVADESVYAWNNLAKKTETFLERLVRNLINHTWTLMAR